MYTLISLCYLEVVRCCYLVRTAQFGTRMYGDAGVHVNV